MGEDAAKQRVQPNLVTDQFGQTLPPAHRPDAVVPCGSCHRCCTKRSVVIPLEEYGDTYDYQTVPFPLMPELNMLAMNDDGSCVYLIQGKCSIYEHRPYMCKIYDCREQFSNFTKREREELVRRGGADKEVFRRAAIMIHLEKKGIKP